jgi:hypothetical protein
MDKQSNTDMSAEPSSRQAKKGHFEHRCAGSIGAIIPTRKDAKLPIVHYLDYLHG